MCSPGDYNNCGTEKRRIASLTSGKLGAITSLNNNYNSRRIQFALASSTFSSPSCVAGTQQSFTFL